MKKIKELVSLLVLIITNMFPSFFPSIGQFIKAQPTLSLMTTVIIIQSIIIIKLLKKLDL